MQAAHGLPGGTQIDAALVLHTSPLAETLREERVVALAVEPLHGHQRDFVYRFPAQRVQCGQCSAAARCRFAAYRQAGSGVAIVHAGVPEVVSTGVVVAVDSVGGGLQVTVQMRIGGRQSGVESFGEISEMGSAAELRGIVLVFHFVLGAVVSVGADGLYPSAVVQRGVDVSPRGEGRRIQSFRYLDRRCCSLHIVGLHSRRVGSQLVLVAPQI